MLSKTTDCNWSEPARSSAVERDVRPAWLPPATSASSRRRRCRADSAVAAAAHAFVEGAVASVMNGVGSEETLAAHVEQVIRGTTFPARAARAGRRPVGREGRHDLRAVRAATDRRRGDRAARGRLHAGGMPAQAVDDARPEQWHQVIFNAATNPIGALTGLTHGRVCERPDLGRSSRARRRGQGGRAGAEHRSRRRPGGAHRPRRTAGCRLRAQGVDAPGRRGPPGDRIDYLNGGIARFGRELGVPTPLHDAVSALIKGVEASWQQQS